MTEEEASSERATGAEDVAAQQARLEAIERRVLNVIGHELRTPVSTVRGLAEVAQHADPVHLRDEIVPALLRNARRAESLLDEMLIASEISTALPVPAPETVDVVSAAKDAWSSLQAAPTTGASRLAIEGSGEARITPTTLRKILDRVLDNAFKYASDDPSLRVVDDTDHVRVTVEAPGPEMHPEEVELATEAFFRGEQAVMTSPGLGLGLTVARALAEQEGGTLFVEHRPGGGLRTIIEMRTA